jgi:hypothetical protein
MISMFSSANRTAELLHTRTSLSVRLVHAENRVVVQVKGYGAAVGLKITLLCFEVGVSALAGHKAQLHQSALRVSIKTRSVTGRRSK